jgi:hypothetical protein
MLDFKLFNIVFIFVCVSFVLYLTIAKKICEDEAVNDGNQTCSFNFKYKRLQRKILSDEPAKKNW